MILQPLSDVPDVVHAARSVDHVAPGSLRIYTPLTRRTFDEIMPCALFVDLACFTDARLNASHHNQLTAPIALSVAYRRSATLLYSAGVDSSAGVTACRCSITASVVITRLNRWTCLCGSTRCVVRIPTPLYSATSRHFQRRRACRTPITRQREIGRAERVSQPIARGLHKHTRRLVQRPGMDVYLRRAAGSWDRTFLKRI